MGGICNGPLPPKARCLEWLVLSNHYHVVLHVDRDCCNNADAKDIVRRWHLLYKPKDVSQKYINGEHLESHELNQIDVLIDTWRKRLHDISWFMKSLNENIARRANKEDDCTGHFWEARYKSCLLYTSPSARDQRGSRMPSSA